MDNVERMYRHLVRTIRSKFPQYLTQPFDVATLQQTILPYRHHRRELGLETNEDYELTMTELLSGAGARDYLIVDDHVRDVLKRDLASPNPDPGAFKQFSTSMVALSPAALRSLEAGPDDPSTPLKTVAVPTVEEGAPPRAPAPAPAASAASAVSSAAPAASAATSQAATIKTEPTQSPPVPPSLAPARGPSGDRAVVPQPGDQCRYCAESLPPGRPITFCPHCGQNLTTMHCLACGSELEVGWKFCPACGRPASAK